MWGGKTSFCCAAAWGQEWCSVSWHNSQRVGRAFQRLVAQWQQQKSQLLCCWTTGEPHLKERDDPSTDLWVLRHNCICIGGFACCQMWLWIYFKDMFFHRYILFYYSCGLLLYSNNSQSAPSPRTRWCFYSKGNKTTVPLRTSVKLKMSC